MANVALHGLETAITKALPNRRVINGKWHNWRPNVIRYCDDFVILHKDVNAIKECKKVAQEWLREMGLTLKPSKTKIVHSLEYHEENPPGFNFLGFNIRQYKVGRYKSGKNNGKLLGFNTVIKPSKDSIKVHYRQIADTIRKNVGNKQEGLIALLNPQITGWSNYYSTANSSSIFNKIDSLIFWKTFRWCKYRHPNKSRYWVVNKYFIRRGNNNWCFGRNNVFLKKHYEIKIHRHVKVKAETSPFDGNWTYWSIRLADYPGTPIRVNKALKRQKGRCGCCGQYFHPDDSVEIHHVDGNRHNNHSCNLKALHLHCHDQLHSGVATLRV